MKPSPHIVVDGGGNPGPPVVLCYGLGGKWFDWDDVARVLAADRTVVRYDRPGYDLGAPSEMRPTVHGEADRVRDVLDALELPGPAVVVGHSLGGFYAEGFARLYPDRTAGVLLLDASTALYPYRVIPTRWRVSMARRAARAVNALGVQRLLGTSVRRVLNHSIPPDGITLTTRYRMERVYRHPAFLEATLVENASYPAMSLELAALRRTAPLPPVPVIVAAAHTERPTPWGWIWLREQQWLAQRLTARFEVIRPAHHHAMIDQPHRVATLIREISG